MTCPLHGLRGSPARAGINASKPQLFTDTISATPYLYPSAPACPAGSTKASGQKPPYAGNQFGRTRRNPPTHQNPPLPIQTHRRQHAKQNFALIGRNGRNKVCAAAAKQQFRGKLVAPPAPRNIAHGTGRTRKIDEGQKARNPARGSVQDQSSNSGKRLLHKTKEQAAQPRECAATRTIRRPHSIKRKYVRSANHSASASDAPNQALKARPAVLTAHSNIARVDGATE